MVCLAALCLAALCLGACSGAGSGEACSSAGDCRGELECIANESGTGQCMAPCAAGEWLCDDGAVCLESPSEGMVCWFGGRTSYAAPCTSALECEPGTFCERGLCLQACMVAVSAMDAGAAVTACEADERCVAVVAGTDDGVCVPPDPEDIDGSVPDAGVTSP